MDRSIHPSNINPSQLAVITDESNQCDYNCCDGSLPIERGVVIHPVKLAMKM